MAPPGRRAPPIGATQSPDLIAEELETAQLDALDPRFELEDVRVLSAALAGSDASAGRVRRAQLQDVDLGESRLRAVRLVDVSAERLDAANGDWAGAQLRRVLFSDARLTGLSLAEAQIEQVSFRACKLDYANFRHSTLAHVSFEDCVLTGADFQGASVEATRFDGCELVETDFSEASMSLVDLRGSRLEPAGSLRGLRGAIVDSVQLIELAGQLAHELGILVEDRQL
jgi:uncharacterized protein YjbI with pentapeptide repeats